MLYHVMTFTHKKCDFKVIPCQWLRDPAMWGPRACDPPVDKHLHIKIFFCFQTKDLNIMDHGHPPAITILSGNLIDHVAVIFSQNTFRIITQILALMWQWTPTDSTFSFKLFSMYVPVRFRVQFFGRHRTVFSKMHHLCFSLLLNCHCSPIVM